MVKKITVYLAFAFIFLAVFLIVSYNQRAEKDITGIIHSEDIVMSETDEAIPLSFTWISVLITLLIVVALIQIIKTKRQRSERKEHILRKPKLTE